MGLGGTAKKLQKVMNAAEELYAKMNEVIGQLNQLREEVEETSRQVDRMEYEVTEQRAILEGVAAELDVDVDAVLEAADLPEAPDEGDDATDQGTDGEQADGTDEGADGDATRGDQETVET